MLNDNFPLKKFSFFICCLVLTAAILSVLINPRLAKAEIATTQDWIGLFPINSGYTKNDTYAGCPSLDSVGKHCWVYANNCTRTFGSTPLLDRSGQGSNPAPCTFSLDPAPPPGYYVFRLMANDTETVDAVIATSKQMYSGSTTLPPSAVNGKLYRINGNLTINNDITVNTTGVIFIDGDLFINTNILNNSATKGLVFIVKGTIYINRTVETINAFLIGHGKVLNPSTSKIEDTIPFCSAWNSTTPPIPDDGSTTCIDDPIADNQKYLTINGSVISLNPNVSPLFVRKKYDAILGNAPAETINYDPKYLVIMRDIFSRDLKIWQEIQ